MLLVNLVNVCEVGPDRANWGWIYQITSWRHESIGRGWRKVAAVVSRAPVERRQSCAFHVPLCVSYMIRFAATAACG